MMMQVLSLWVSRIFHPLFMPFLAMMLVFRYNRLLTFNIPSDAQMLIVALIFAYTIFLPLMAVLFLKRIKLVQSFEMHSRDERKWAYLLSALCYYICYYILSGYSGLVIISTLMLGATIALMLLVFANLFFKISAHMTGIGGLCGIFYGLVYVFGMDYRPLIMGLFLLAGVIGWARLSLDAHKEAEIYTGFALGFCSECGLLILLG